jgi:hypothetical protein
MEQLLRRRPTGGVRDVLDVAIARRGRSLLTHQEMGSTIRSDTRIRRSRHLLVDDELLGCQTVEQDRVHSDSVTREDFVTSCQQDRILVAPSLFECCVAIVGDVLRASQHFNSSTGRS